ncbi:Crp/Fnr family transcriptional regulator [Pedobacter nutrimenti]|uniref:Crp/Fnr family transcriptional regulator n=1 Tax=Pedobacter nutrimenti TaxID=1241337 RepID=UPI00293104BB|nr:Crp/Fnr family transcriptional regulator [Pedobacter nutrimenti]
MKLKKKKPAMEYVPMPEKAFKKLIAYLASIKKPLPEKLEPYLDEVMKAAICRVKHDIHKQGDVIGKAYYIVRGFMMAYYLDEAGHEHVLRIYSEGEIVAGNGFMNGSASRYYLKIYDDSFVLEITHAQMETGYRTIEKMDELARLTIASFENKEIEKDEKIRKGGEDSVLHFYLSHRGLLPAGKVIKDAHIASYLHMKISSLTRIRASLIKKGLLLGVK